jgi:hypothetical protein
LVRLAGIGIASPVAGSRCPSMGQNRGGRKRKRVKEETERVRAVRNMPWR